MGLQPGRGGPLCGQITADEFSRTQIQQQGCHTGQVPVGQLVGLVHARLVTDEDKAAPYQRKRSQRPQQQLACE